MTNLMPFHEPGGLGRRDRRLEQTFYSLDARRRYQLASVEAAADIQAMKVDAVAYVGKRAMHNVAMLSQLEGQLATLVPLATGRLQAIGDMTALAITEVVSDTLRRLG